MPTIPPVDLSKLVNPEDYQKVRAPVPPGAEPNPHRPEKELREAHEAQAKKHYSANEEIAVANKWELPKYPAGDKVDKTHDVIKNKSGAVVAGVLKRQVFDKDNEVILTDPNLRYALVRQGDIKNEGTSRMATLEVRTRSGEVLGTLPVDLGGGLTITGNAAGINLDLTRLKPAAGEGKFIELITLKSPANVTLSKESAVSLHPVDNHLDATTRTTIRFPAEDFGDIGASKVILSQGPHVMLKGYSVVSVPEGEYDFRVTAKDKSGQIYEEVAFGSGTEGIAAAPDSLDKQAIVDKAKSLTETAIRTVREQASKSNGQSNTYPPAPPLAPPPRAR